MGLCISIAQQTAKVLAAPGPAQQAYVQVIGAMEADEAANKQQASNNGCNLTIFYVQSLLACCFELPMRIIMHGSLAVLYTCLACCTLGNVYVQFNAWRQQLYFHLYLCIFPNILLAFVCNPCNPELYIFLDHYKLNRPPNPSLPSFSNQAARARAMLGGSMFPYCSLNRQQLISVLGLPDADSTFFRWTFFFYGGMAALHPLMCLPVCGDFHDLGAAPRNIPGTAAYNNVQPNAAQIGANSIAQVAQAGQNLDNTCGVCEGAATRYEQHQTKTRGFNEQHTITFYQRAFPPSTCWEEHLQRAMAPPPMAQAMQRGAGAAGNPTTSSDMIAQGVASAAKNAAKQGLNSLFGVGKK
jgi:hypothetical protein